MYALLAEIRLLYSDDVHYDVRLTGVWWRGSNEATTC